MKLTKRDQKLLIVLACVLLLAGAYQFGYRYFGDKRHAIENEIKTLQVKLDDFRVKDKNRDKYLADTEENNAQIASLLAKYPSELGNENEIYFSKLLEDSTGARVLQMSYTDPQSFYLGEEQEVKNEINGDLSTSTITIESDYSQFKKVIEYIAANPSRKVIQDINLSYDNKSGTIGGTIAYNNYSLTGTNTTYEPYNIPSESNGQGVSNLFGDLIKK